MPGQGRRAFASSRSARPATRGDIGTGDGGGDSSEPEPRTDPEPVADPNRRLVIHAGNRAWQAAAAVRHRWLAASLFARRSVPREVHAFLAGNC